MKTKKSKTPGKRIELTTPATEPDNGPPKYYLADVPQYLRARVLDLCTRRYYHQALELLQMHSITRYTYEDLLSFYDWAPATLPSGQARRSVPSSSSLEPCDYSQPLPELLADIRSRLDSVPPDIMEQVHAALKEKSLDFAASLLWKAGASFTSAELYEFRKTLFLPNALIDAYTSGPPVLRDRSVDDPSAAAPEEAGRGAGPATAAIPADPCSSSPPDRGCVPQEPGQPQHAEPLQQLRERLVQLLAAREFGDDSRPSVDDALANAEPVTIHDAQPTHHARPTLPPLPPGEARASDSRLVGSEGPSPIHPTIHSSPASSIFSSGSALLSDLRDLITRYVILPDMAAEALALWVVHTYAFTLREVTTYIAVVSPEKRCGKTTLLELLGLLAHEAAAAANISPSALFRVIEEIQPTLIIDEADTFLQARDEMAGILNAGYRKSNSYVVRVADGKPRKTRPVGAPGLPHPAPVGPVSSPGLPLVRPVPQPAVPDSPVGPVPRPGAPDLAQSTNDRIDGSAGTPRPALEGSTESRPTSPAQPMAGDGSPSPRWGEGRGEVSSSTSPLGGSRLARYSCWCPKVMAAIGRLPDTLADRCIVITMQRKMSGEKCERMRHLNPAEFRERCADFVREHSAAIAAAQPEIPAALNDRAGDIWEPLFAIADLAGGDWPRLARQAALKLSGYDDDVPLIGYLLSDVRDWMLIRKTDRALSRHLVSSFKASSHRAWEDLRRGHEINEHWLAAKMRDLGIHPTYIRIAEVTGRGYLLSEVESGYRRYVPNPDVKAIVDAAPSNPK